MRLSGSLVAALRMRIAPRKKESSRSNSAPCQAFLARRSNPYSHFFSPPATEIEDAPAPPLARLPLFSPLALAMLTLLAPMRFSRAARQQ